MKNRILYVLPECYVDTNLIEYLLDAHVNHQHSCTKVIENLKNTYKDRFAIGIIDRDKKQMGYIDECDEIAKTKHLSLLKHKIQNHYIITIKPAVDRFILDCAIQQAVHTEDYGLPAKLKDFTNISKSVTSNTDSRFKNLFKALRSNQEFRNLRISLEYMVQHKYDIDPNVLRNLFEKP